MSVSSCLEPTLVSKPLVKVPEPSFTFTEANINPEMSSSPSGHSDMEMDPEPVPTSPSIKSIDEASTDNNKTSDPVDEGHNPDSLPSSSIGNNTSNSCTDLQQPARHKGISTINAAVDASTDEPWSILHFGFKVATQEEKEKQHREDLEEIEERAKEREWFEQHRKMRREAEIKEGARDRKRKSREAKKEHEIRAGIHDPLGRKRRVSSVDSNIFYIVIDQHSENRTKLEQHTIKT